MDRLLRFLISFSLLILSQSFNAPTSRQRSSLKLSSDLTHEEIARYSRHLVLGDVGMQGQQKIKQSSVLVIGAGGLGSPCLLYLAAAGVGHVGIVDADTVDVSNLQRQVIHGTSTVGVTKCESAATRMKDVNPLVKIRLYQEEFTSATAERIVGEGFSKDVPYDIVIDGSDNFPTKYLINDMCAMMGLPWVYSAILAFEGQISTFNCPPGVGPDYRDLLPTPPPPGDVPSCAEGGVLGVLPGTFGCLQATEALKYIMYGSDTSRLICDRVLVMDAMTMKFSDIGLVRDSNRPPIDELIDYQGFCGGPQTSPTPAESNARTMDEAEADMPATVEVTYHSIDPADCLKKLTSGWTPWVLDVRLQTENDIVKLPFTDKVSPHRTVRVTDIPVKGDVLVYCKAGVRGKKACNRLIELGVDPKRLYNLSGGIMKWQKEVDPSMPRY